MGQTLPIIVCAAGWGLMGYTVGSSLNRPHEKEANLSAAAVNSAVTDYVVTNDCENPTKLRATVMDFYGKRLKLIAEVSGMSDETVGLQKVAADEAMQLLGKKCKAIGE